MKEVKEEKEEEEEEIANAESFCKRSGTCHASRSSG